MPAVYRLSFILYVMSIAAYGLLAALLVTCVLAQDGVQTCSVMGKVGACAVNGGGGTRICDGVRWSACNVTECERGYKFAPDDNICIMCEVGTYKSNTDIATTCERCENAPVGIAKYTNKGERDEQCKFVCTKGYPVGSTCVTLTNIFSTGTFLLMILFAIVVLLIRAAGKRYSRGHGYRH